MQPPLQELIDRLATIRAELSTIVTTTPAPDFDRAPARGGWTGTGVIAHLGTVEGMATKLLEGLFAKALADGIGPARAGESWIRSLDQFNVLDRGTRIDAPERAHPPATAQLTASWESLLGVRQRLLRAVTTVDGRDLTAITAPHPVFGPLNGYQWVLIIGLHEHRHLAQLREAIA